MNKKIAIISAITLGAVLLTTTALVGSNLTSGLLSIRAADSQEMKITLTAANVTNVQSEHESSYVYAMFDLVGKPQVDKSHDFKISCTITSDTDTDYSQPGANGHIFSMNSVYTGSASMTMYCDAMEGLGGSGLRYVSFYANDTFIMSRNISYFDDPVSSETYYYYDLELDWAEWNLVEQNVNKSFGPGAQTITIDRIDIGYYCYR